MSRTFEIVRRAIAGMLVLLLAQPAFAADKSACISSAEEGQVLKNEGKLVRAKASLLTCARADCPAAVAQDCVQWLQEIDKKLGAITVKAVDAEGRDVSGVRGFVDGAAAAAGAEVDPGPHTVRAEADGFSPGEQSVTLAPGERRTITVTLAPASASANVTHAVPLAPTPAEVPAEKKGGRSVPVVAWVLGGVGVVGLGLFATFGALGLSEQSSLKSTCAPTCTDAQVDPVKVDFAVANTALVTGLVALGAATVITILTLTKPQPASALRAPVITF
jgi:hypothetical protein